MNRTKRAITPGFVLIQPNNSCVNTTYMVFISPQKQLTKHTCIHKKKIKNTNKRSEKGKNNNLSA